LDHVAERLQNESPYGRCLARNRRIPRITSDPEERHWFARTLAPSLAPDACSIRGTRIGEDAQMLALPAQQLLRVHRVVVWVVAMDLARYGVDLTLD